MEMEKKNKSLEQKRWVKGASCSEIPKWDNPLNSTRREAGESPERLFGKFGPLTYLQH